MPGGLGPRLVLEAGFLILLAVAVGFADLSPALIILVMALGWVFVSLIEYFAWRQGPRFPARFASATHPGGAIVEEEIAVGERPPPPPTPEPAPAPTPPPEEQTVVERAPEPATPAAEEEAPEFEQERRTPHRLEPLQPRPRRRWGLFGPRDRPEGEEPESREEEW
jgi:hypothetical protein